MLKLNWMVTLTAVVMGAGAYWLKSMSDEIVNHGVRVQGEVTGSERNMRHMKNYYTYYPTIKFDTADGQHITATSQTGSDKPSFKIGETLPIIYDKDNPKKWSIDNWMDLWGTSTALGTTALVILMFAPDRTNNKKIDLAPAGSKKESW